MELFYVCDVMFCEFILKLMYGNDGLIFICLLMLYLFGMDEYILKWKLLYENIIDFWLYIVEFLMLEDEDG